MQDLISRQAAINNIKNGFHWETVNGITAQAVLKQVIHDIEIMPSVQPEIIRCKDCEHWDTTWQNDFAPNYHYCPLIDGTRRDDFYCADAERRTDEQTKD